MALIGFFNIIICAEILAIVAALFTVTNKAATYWKFFAVFLILTVFAEAAGFYMARVIVKPNYPVYNFLMLVQASFFSFLFYKFLESRKLRLWILAFYAFFILFFISEGVLIAFSKRHEFSRYLLSILVVLFSCTFYYTQLRNDEIKNPVRHAPFWIITGLFFYYFGTVPMFAFYKTISKIKLTGSVSFYTLVMGCLSCILYGSWIIGFIWKRKQIQSSRQ